MPTRCWAAASGLALLLAGSAALADGAFVQAQAAGAGATRLVFATRPATAVTVQRDARVPAAARPQDVQLVASVGDGVAIVADSYRSRLNSGGGQCGAGTERFLRVLRLRPLPARETYKLKLESCWDGVELNRERGNDGLEWSADAATLRVHWLFGPTASLTAEQRVLQVAPDGAVRVLKPE